jgi:hypothetical protein
MSIRGPIRIILGFQTKKKRRGTHGKPIIDPSAAFIAAQHQYIDIRVESIKGKGSIFNSTLPFNPIR